ncbi:MAG: hypothetical protein IKT32_04030, partial [Clostridia bacterium]|nr:hypothetical protein [Clostridia bacterium]
KQILTISTKGDSSIVPSKRKFAVRFKDILDGEIALFVNGKLVNCEEVLTNCAALDVAIEPNNEYRVEVLYTPETQMQKLVGYAKKVLICGRERTAHKAALWDQLLKAKDKAEYIKIIDETDLIKEGLKTRLKEIL